jgi:uncharacterized Zn-finger protein
MINHSVVEIKSDRNFLCEICNNNFTTKGNLKNHILSIHKKIKPFKCDLCETSYTNKCRLVIHLRTHVNFFKTNISYIVWN